MKSLIIIHDYKQNDNVFPINMGYISTYLKEYDSEVDTFCMDTYHYTNQQLADFLDKRDYDLICLNFLAPRFKETIIDLAKVINKHKKNAWFVVGGHGPSPIPNYILDKIKCDCVVIGEGELVLKDIVDDKLSDNNKVIYYGKPIKRLDDIKYPDWDNFPLKRYVGNLKFPNQADDETMCNMISTRGCVNRCNFCYRLEKGIRTRSVDNVIGEIKELQKRLGNKLYIEFSDECFVLSKKRMEEFKQKLKENKIKISYWCAARVDMISEEILQLMKDTGCKFINYGFESMDDNVLKLMNKNTTSTDNRRAARLTKAIGIPFGLNFIWNNLGDTKASLWESVEFIKKYNFYEHIRTIKPVTPYPGCPLYYEAINRGLLDGPEDFFNRFKNSDRITVNYTYMSNYEMYNELFMANADLLIDHCRHTGIPSEVCHSYINTFYDLYFKDNYSFRGLRHYEKSK